jgi:hypothetical protein
MKKELPIKNGKVRRVRFAIENSRNNKLLGDIESCSDKLNKQLEELLVESQKMHVFTSFLKPEGLPPDLTKIQASDTKVKKKEARQKRASIESWKALEKRIEENAK